MFDDKRYPSNILQLESDFSAKLLTYSEQVNSYESVILQTQALSVIPVEELSLAAKSLSNRIPNSKEFRHELLLQLLAWFKHKFFKWVDAPACDHCQSPTTFVENLSPTSAELRDGGGRVEGYRCNGCHKSVRFARFNNPAKLLETRCGRCGEWVNCFTLCARALGFEARFVVDWTDHVWTEVWSDLEHRWLHCDPCENVCDKPLLYEQGWGKKLTYVLAFSHTEVVDVSWRYSAQHSQLIARRLLCRERWLLDTVQRLNIQKQQILTEAEKNKRCRRSLSEFVQFLSPNIQIGDANLAGRTTGSEAWRRARGELGKEHKNETVIKLEPEELERKELLLKYCCGQDRYERGQSGRISPGWQSLTFNAQNIFRKEENDWNTCYLARTEGTESGKIEWKIDLAGSEAKSFSIDMHTKSFENGIVRVVVCAGDACHMMTDKDTSLRLNKQDLSSCTQISISATLSGSSGPVAWQHAQLFRSAMGASDNSFTMKILLD